MTAEHGTNGSGRKALNWIFGFLGTGFLATIGWLAVDYMKLREAFATHIAWSEQRNNIMQDIKDEQQRRSSRLSAMEVSLAAINSRVLTGETLEVFALKLKAANPLLVVPETK